MEAIMSWLPIHWVVPTSYIKLRYWLPLGRTLYVCKLRKILRRPENSRGSKLRRCPSSVCNKKRANSLCNALLYVSDALSPTVARSKPLARAPACR